MPTVECRKISPVTHGVKIVDRTGGAWKFHRLAIEFSPGRYWELWSEQRQRWEPYGSPIVEAFLENLIKE